MLKCQMLLNYIALSQVKRDMKRSRQDLEPIVNSRLKKVLVTAYKHVPYYREIMNSIHYNPQKDFKGPEDLRLLPILTTSIIKERGEEEFVREDVEPSRFFFDTTSGSTGKPLRVWRGPYARALQIAKWLRTLMVNGYQPTDRVLSLSSPARLNEGRSLVQHFGLFRRRPIDYLLPPEAMVDEIFAYQPDVLYGNRSHLDLIAMELQRQRTHFDKLKLVLAGAEIISERNRKLYREAFQTEVIEWYGTVEMGILAFETQAHDGLHLCEDLIYYEFLDENGSPTQPGQRSRLILTELTNTLMPFIRYDQGDWVVLKPDDNNHNSEWRRLSKVEGRDDDFALLPDGCLVPFHVFYEIMDKYSKIKQFRIIQKGRSLFHILIVADSAYLESVQQNILSDYRRNLPDGVRFEIKLLDSIKADPSGKLRMLISEVD